MWHKMSLIGKILIFLTGLGFGMAIGFYYGNSGLGPPDGGNSVEINVDGTIKKDGDVNITLDNDQSLEKEEEKEKKGFWFFR